MGGRQSVAGRVELQCGPDDMIQGPLSMSCDDSNVTLFWGCSLLTPQNPGKHAVAQVAQTGQVEGDISVIQA